MPKSSRVKRAQQAARQQTLHQQRSPGLDPIDQIGTGSWHQDVVPMGKEDALDSLRGYVMAHRSTGRDVETMVRYSRQQGATWDEVATVLGVTRQAASRRFADRDDG